MDSNTTKIIATCFELAPVGLGFCAYKYSTKSLRLFVFFLFYGFITDILTGMLNKNYNTLAWLIFLTYTCIESVFFLHFIKMQNFFVDWVKKLLIAFIIILPVLFFPFHINLATFQPQPTEYYGYFAFIYQLTASAFCTAAILKLIETHTQTKSPPNLYLLAGIFVYCFCAVIVDASFSKEMREQIWFVHDIIHIIAYCFFSFAFIQIIKNKSIFNNANS